MQLGLNKAVAHKWVAYKWPIPFLPHSTLFREEMSMKKFRQDSTLTRVDGCVDEELDKKAEPSAVIRGGRLRNA